MVRYKGPVAADGRGRLEGAWGGGEEVGGGEGGQPHTGSDGRLVSGDRERGATSFDARGKRHQGPLGGGRDGGMGNLNAQRCDPAALTCRSN